MFGQLPLFCLYLSFCSDSVDAYVPYLWERIMLKNLIKKEFFFYRQDAYDVPFSFSNQRRHKICHRTVTGVCQTTLLLSLLFLVCYHRDTIYTKLGQVVNITYLGFFIKSFSMKSLAMELVMLKQCASNLQFITMMFFRVSSLVSPWNGDKPLNLRTENTAKVLLQFLHIPTHSCRRHFCYCTSDKSSTLTSNLLIVRNKMSTLKLKDIMHVMKKDEQISEYRLVKREKSFISNCVRQLFFFSI